MSVAGADTADCVRAGGRDPRPADRADRVGQGHRRRDRHSRSARARCSGWSASRARARRPSGWRCSATAAPAAGQRRRGADRRDRPRGTPGVGAAPAPRRRRLLHTAGSRHRAQPGAADRHQLSERSRRTARTRRARIAITGSARRSERSRCRPTTTFLRRYPHQLSGRPAAARRDRDGVRLPPASDRVRRADDRPRRHHPGAGARDDPRPVPQRIRSPRCTSATTSPSSPSSPTTSR